MYDSETGRIVAARNVIFDESMQGGISTEKSQCTPTFLGECTQNVAENENERQVGTESPHDIEQPQSTTSTEAIETTDESEEQVIELMETPVSQTRTRREIRKPGYLNDYDCESHMAFLTGLPEIPRNYSDVQGSEDEAKWRSAIADEINSLEKNQTWEIVKPVRGIKVISSRWIFKKKPDAVGNSTRFKARLVAKGYMQRQGLDYDDTYSPVARLATIRLLMSVSFKFNFKMHHLDVVTAFLHGNLIEDVYMKVPDGFDVEQGNVLKLKKSLYGLKQSPKCWNDRFHTFICKLGFKRSNADYCLYTRVCNGSTVYLIIYVDDMIIAGDNNEQISDIKVSLFNEFDMKDLGIVKQFMGLNIEIDEKGELLTIDQSQYIDAILKRFGMIDCKPSSTPMMKNLKLTIGNPEQQTVLPYRELLGSLMYLMLGSRPDICFSLSYLSRFQDSATDEHFQHLKKILRYLKGTSSYKLRYNRNDDNILVGYADADWANDSVDRKSTSGYIFKVFGNVVSWGTKKQGLVTLSTCEAEFVAACAATTEALWIKKIIGDMEIKLTLIQLSYSKTI